MVSVVTDSVADETCTPGIVAALWLVAFIAFVIGLGEPPVWSKDEARPGLVAKEMVATGHWTVPHIGGRIYVEKPPLFMWIVALLSRHGVTEWTLRLPSALAAATTVAATYAIGARVIPGGAGLVAAAILTSSFTFFQWARTGRMEALFSLWITLSFWSLLRWFDGRRLADAAAFGFWVGLGVLTKGPGALIPVAVGALILLRPGPSRAGAARAASLAALVAGGIVLAWLGTAAATAPDFAEYVAGVGPRFAHEVGQRPHRPALYVFQVLGMGLIPWILAVPGATVLLVRARREVSRALAVPLLWAAVLLILFTVLVRPREVYFLPVYPALAILLGWAWDAASRRARWALAAPLLALLGAAGAAALVAAAAGVTVNVHGTYVAITFGLATLAAAVAAATLLAAVAMLRAQRPTAAGVAIALGITALFVVFEMWIHSPGLNLDKPVRTVAARLAERLPPSAEVAYLDRKQVTALVFYIPHHPIELHSPRDVHALADRPGLAVVVPENYLGIMQSAAARPLVPLARAELDGTWYVMAAFR